MRDLGVRILVGEEASREFDYDAERMRKANAEAFARLRELFIEYITERGLHDTSGTGSGRGGRE